MGILTNVGSFFTLNAIGAWKMGQEQVWDRHKALNEAELPKGDGKIIVITGGNRGIGFEAVKVFLKLGYRVIIGCRRPQDCLKSLEGHEGAFEAIALDLTSFESVRKFAKELLDREDVKQIDVLANNAGIMMTPLNRTKEGHESQFGVNHLAHFLLTSLLMPLLRATPNPRVVNVSSAAHFGGRFTDFDDLGWKRNSYNREGAYANSKVAQVLFTRRFHRVHGAETGVNMIAIHPGVVNTGLYEHVGLLTTIFGFAMKTPRQGAETLIHAAIGADIEGQGGIYLENSHVATPLALTADENVQDKLWKESMQFVGLEKFF